LWPVSGFAVAFAYVEAAIVVYLRRVLGVEDIIHDVPVFDPFIAATELGREAATLLLLLAAGWAAGRSLQSRLGFAFFAFGLWDIFYYVWLKVLLDWPASLLDPDILFLIPLPWWGPVLSPVLIAILCAIAGALAVAGEDRGKRIRPTPLQWTLLGAGTIVVLCAFMADAIAALPATAEELNRLRPRAFRWGLYLPGLAAMAWGILRPAWPWSRAGR
jgi:hypothetical protein